VSDQTAASVGPARLRGHHLICLHFFDGEGYSEGFVDNLRTIIAMADRNGVVLVEGADAVCGPCAHLMDGVCEDEPEIDRLDRLARSLLSAEPGARLVWAEVRDRLPDVLDAWYVGACEECSFLTVCTGAGLCDLCETAACELEAEVT
jgi:hypothetical protein